MILLFQNLQKKEKNGYLLMIYVEVSFYIYQFQISILRSVTDCPIYSFQYLRQYYIFPLVHIYIHKSSS